MRALPWPKHEEPQRMQFPAYGQFGFDQPVGRKHYNSRLSAIHKVIFNDQTPSLSRQEYIETKKELKQPTHHTPIKRDNSLQTDSYSLNKSYSYVQSPQIYGVSSDYHLAKKNSLGESGVSMRSPYVVQMKNRQQMDKMLNPYKQWQFQNEHQRKLNDLIKARSHNPTFLNSQLL